MIVLFTKRAERKFRSITDYISQEFGQSTATIFNQKVESFVEILKKYPEIGSLEFKEKQIRGFQLTTQTKLFYRIKEEKIIILTFFDVRQHPSKKLK